MESSDEPLKDDQEGKPSESDDNTFVLVLYWCNQYGAAITAIATIVLAVITYFYLQETSKQRELLYTQLVYTISPDVTIHMKPFKYERNDLIGTGSTFVNKGGPTGEFKYEVYLVCCNDLKQTINNIGNTTVLAKLERIHRISSDTGHGVTMGILRHKKTFEKAVKLESGEVLIFAFVKITYIKPKILTQNETMIVTEEASFWWNPIYETWMNTQEQHHKILKAIIYIKRKSLITNQY